MEADRRFNAVIKPVKGGFQLIVNGRTIAGPERSEYRLIRNEVPGFNVKVLLLRIDPVPTEGDKEVAVAPFIEAYENPFPYTEVHIIERENVIILDDLPAAGSAG